MNNSLWCLSLLSKEQRLKTAVFLAVMSFTNVLEILGLFFYGVLVSLIAEKKDFESFSFEIFSFQLVPAGVEENFFLLFAGLGFTCLIFFFFRSFLNYKLLKKLLTFLSACSTKLGSRLFNNYLNMGLQSKNETTPSNVSFIFIWSINAATVVTISQLVVIATDLTLLISIGTLLFFKSPILTFFLFLYFGVIFLGLQYFLSRKAKKLSKEANLSYLNTSDVSMLGITSPREIFMSKKEGYVLNLYSRHFQKFNDSQAQLNAVITLPKYVYDVVLIGGLIGIFLITYNFESIDDFDSLILLFLAAASRAMPSVVRIQNAILTLKIAGAQTNQLHDFTAKHPELLNNYVSIQSPQPYRSFPAPPSIVISNLKFRYFNSQTDVIKGLNLRIAPGEILGLKGNSGSGKSTLMDLMIGALEPSSGTVEYLCDGYENVASTDARNYGIGYVPQETVLIPGTIIENICFGVEEDFYDYSRLDHAIEIAELKQLIRDLPKGVRSRVGRAGESLSGGQVQRIGIARAIYGRPTVLLLDEATSALDTDTESKILENLNRIKSEMTILLVAHRSSALEKTDRIFTLMEDLDHDSLNTTMEENC